jgi:hypothetical protein
MNAWMKDSSCHIPGVWRKLLRLLTNSAPVAVACVMAVATGGAMAQTVTNTVLYQLDKDSSFEQGCFPPCLCPTWTPVPVFADTHRV